MTIPNCDYLIAYTPLADEPDWRDLPFSEVLKSSAYCLAPDKRVNPLTEAAACAEKYVAKKVCVLVPGTQFDRTGTRHGRGGGWYDRFLSQIPRAWVRIGVAKESQVSEIPLTRESWDEPMDEILIQTKTAWISLKTDKK